MFIQLGDQSPKYASKQTWVAPGAVLIGDAILGVDASIWFGAVVRADQEPISIGDRTNIQDLCVLHTDPGFPITLGVDCTIGHRAILHGCSIGDGSLVGMGAIVLNGARIGNGCLIGAGALVPEGAEIPDGTLAVGMPARGIRELSAADKVGLRDAAARYVQRSKQYLSQARVIEDPRSAE
ncbi:gamma carbonic anhydrase family protein [Roseiconus nitratireducens]|uniref:Gamma carbonic anhydrase family protein n=2 Tax=Roseiconus nitratireducens TaxID=2605748 RepID=A0A5M6D9F3_9BACT|nr:gamma carbonic anhydrase family protein [Roseiconus nitratireducens]